MAQERIAAKSFVVGTYVDADSRLAVEPADTPFHAVQGGGRVCALGIDQDIDLVLQGPVGSNLSDTRSADIAQQRIRRCQDYVVSTVNLEEQVRVSFAEPPPEPGVVEFDSVAPLGIGCCRLAEPIVKDQVVVPGINAQVGHAQSSSAVDDLAEQTESLRGRESNVRRVIRERGVGVHFNNHFGEAWWDISQYGGSPEQHLPTINLEIEIRPVIQQRHPGISFVKLKREAACRGEILLSEKVIP